MGANGQALRVVVERHHGEDLNHVGQDHTHILVTILAQGKLVWVETAQQDLHYLNQELLQVLSVAIDEVAECF